MSATTPTPGCRGSCCTTRSGRRSTSPRSSHRCARWPSCAGGPTTSWWSINDLPDIAPAIERILAFHEGSRDKRVAPGPAEFFADELPFALLAATESLGGRYDDILVDEAQDLQTDWLTAITGTLRDEREGSIWLFVDDNQRVYYATLTVPDEYRPFDLAVNCRNTQAIHAEVMKLYRGEVRPEVKGPPGRLPQLVHTDDQRAAVAGVLENLCGKEEIRPQDVVVLSGHGRDHSQIYGHDAGRWRYTDKRGRRGSSVFFSSIRGFKGLESPVVVLCELDNLDAASRNNQIYVGMSRARNHCVIVAPPAG